MKNLAAPIIALLRHCGVLRDRRGGPALEILPGGKFFTVNLNAGSCYPV